MGIGDFFRNLFKKKDKKEVADEEECECCKEEEVSQPTPVENEQQTEENKPL